ncbi:glycosyl transferase family 51 [Terriglobus saanensis SP1PR4]|uniref:Glycosyl transferase family 51 n=2 Tax=Terriglobus saanensis TaxID=870903 RepID=E8V8U0_TERSS|nr:glycosyl transferase family 51 [Terriglobus saanensis SP1PR4]
MTCWIDKDGQRASPSSILSDKFFGGGAVRWAFTAAPSLGLPPHLIAFVLLIEDKRFPTHIGVDPIGMVRAFAGNIRGRMRQGGSTIPQQLANVRRISGSGIILRRNLRYKGLQVANGIRYTLSRTKVALLVEYLGSIYWGRNYYGLERASMGYFGVSAKDLTPCQSFFLAERIANPNRFSPQRIRNLVSRPAIAALLQGEPSNRTDVEKIYREQLTLDGEGKR